jgi:hypothetical protein
MVPEVTARMTAVSSLLEETKAGFDLRQYAFPSKDWAESKTTG